MPTEAELQRVGREWFAQARKQSAEEKKADLREVRRETDSDGGVSDMLADLLGGDGDGDGGGSHGD